MAAHSGATPRARQDTRSAIGLRGRATWRAAACPLGAVPCARRGSIYSEKMDMEWAISVGMGRIKPKFDEELELSYLK